MSIIPQSRVAKAPEVLFQRIRDETVLLDLVGEKYYGLNEVGARVWDLLDPGLSLAEIAETIAAEHDAALPQVQDDLCALADELVAAGLATVVPQ